MSRPIPTDYTDYGYAVLRVVFETRRSARVIVNLYSSVCRAPVCAHSFLAYCTVLFSSVSCARAPSQVLSVCREQLVFVLSKAPQSFDKFKHILQQTTYQRTLAQSPSALQTTELYTYTTHQYYTIERE